MVVGAGVTIESEHGQTTFNSTRLLVVRDGACEPLGACKECALAEWAPGAMQTFAVVGTSIPQLKDAVHRIRPIIDRADLQQECTYGTDLV
jgi:hypothetical protein